VEAHDATPPRKRDDTVILHLNYEELRALRSGARSLLEGEAEVPGSAPAPEARRAVEALLERLDGDLTLSTLSEARGVQTAVQAVVEALRAEMEGAVVATHAADEGAVAAYFDFAHVLGVEHRLGGIASEMEAVIELVTGGRADEDAARAFAFPD